MTEGRRTSPLTVSREETEFILRSMADEVAVLASSWTEEDRGEGGDVDCIVRGLDTSWPLRLPTGMRLCQHIEYDLNSHYWVLDVRGSVLAIDTVEDPKGRGRYGIPTDHFLSLAGGEIFPPPAVRAAYLTIKRIRKRVESRDAWALIAKLAAADPARYESTLADVIGVERAHHLARLVSEGKIPHEEMGRPLGRSNVLVHFSRGARVGRRIVRPTGLLIAVVGPDGSGKSTIAEALPSVCGGFFRRDGRFHWRPGVLPRPGKVVGVPEGDPSDPHGRPPRGPVVSAVLLMYHWSDFLLGSFLRFYPLLVRSSLVIVERGWWDVLVDPRRYRLNVSRRLTASLGRLLPQPALTLICRAPDRVLLERKQELPDAELRRQSETWMALSKRKRGWEILDTSRPLTDVVADVRERVVGQLEARTISRLGSGWVALPPRGARWTLPRGPRKMVRGGLSLYQPMSTRRRAGWEAARLLASLGAFKLTRRSIPPRAVWEVLSCYLTRGGTFAFSRANHPGRITALTLDSDGRPQLFVKIASDEEGKAALQTEAARIQELGALLTEPLRPPMVVDQSDGVLALRAERWRPRRDPWRLEGGVAEAIGRFFAAGSEKRPTGPTHGDLAPWNLLQDSDGWVLVDWESARPDGPAFYDLFHHLVQSHVLLGRPDRGMLLDAVVERGSLGSVVSSYLRTAGLDRSMAVDGFLTYLVESRSYLDAVKEDGQKGLRIRDQLVREVQRRR